MCECFSWDEPREIFSWDLAHTICNRWNQSGCSFEWITQLVDKGRSSGCSSKACVSFEQHNSLNPDVWVLPYPIIDFLWWWCDSFDSKGLISPVCKWKHLFDSWWKFEMFRLCWQEVCTCWGIFLFLLNRDTINISSLIPGKSISHSQTIQAAQGILCPCRAAAKGFLKPAGFSFQLPHVGSQHSHGHGEQTSLSEWPPALPSQTLAQITRAEVRADPSRSNKEFQIPCCHCWGKLPTCSCSLPV